MKLNTVAIAQQVENLISEENELYKEDRKSLLSIGKEIRQENFIRAAKKMRDLDTIIRDMFSSELFWGIIFLGKLQQKKKLYS